MAPLVCVTEFTDLTREALAAATLLARRTGDMVHLVRSVDEREQFPFNLRNRLIEPDRRRLAAEARELRQLGFDFEELVLRGMPEDSVARYAWHARARTIVAGCRPAARLEHWALGCIAEEISETSLVPVLAIRSARPFHEWLEQGRPMKVLAGFDPDARPDAVLHRLEDLRQMADCLITTALVRYPEVKPASGEANAHEAKRSMPANAGGRVAKALADRQLPFVDLTHEPDDPADALVQHARNVDADLLVIATHPRDDLTVLPHRTLAHGALRRAPMNVLCVPESDIEPPHKVITQVQLETLLPASQLKGPRRIHFTGTQENS